MLNELSTESPDRCHPASRRHHERERDFGFVGCLQEIFRIKDVRFYSLWN